MSSALPLPPRPATTVLARILTGPAAGEETVDSARRGPSARRVTRVGRAAKHGLTVLVLGLLTMGVIVLSQGSTNAYANGVCIDEPASNTWSPDGIRTGVDGLIDQTGPNGTFGDPLPGSYPSIEAAIADASHTDYEKLGTSGAFWSVDYGTQSDDDNACFPIAKIVGNFLANSIFSIDKVGARLSISTYQWASSPGILSPLNQPLDDVVHTYWNGLVQYLVGFFILIGVATVMWQSLVRRRFSLGIGSIVWMIFAVTVLFLFVVKPSGVASKMDKTISDVTNLSFAAGAQAAEKHDPHLAATYGAIHHQPNGAQRIASDMLYRVMIFQPWLAGQWGDSTGNAITMTTSPQPGNTPPTWYNSTRDPRYQQLYAQACVIDPTVSVCEDDNSSADASRLRGAEAVTQAMAGAKKLSLNEYSLDWYMVQNWTCESATWCIGPKNHQSGGAHNSDRLVDSSNGWQYRSIWSGDKPDQRILASFTGLIAVIALGGIVFLLAAVIITYDLMLYMLLFLAQFLLLVGIQPTWGRKLAEGLGSQILQNGLKRIMAGLLLSILQVIFGVIQAMTLGWAPKVGLMVGVGVAVILLRKPLMNTVGVLRLGQGSSALEGAEDTAADAAIGRSKNAGRRGAATARKFGRAGAEKAANAPTRIRRGVVGGRAGVEVARDRLRIQAEQGTPLTEKQQIRTRGAAAVRGFVTGAKSRNRFVAERDAVRDSTHEVAMRESSYQRRGDRKYARTEQGRATSSARDVRTAERGAAAQSQRLASRDEDVRVAATAAPRRFTGTAQNFDGYEGQAPVYVDRNRRRPAGPTNGRHARRSDHAVLRGAEQLPPPPEPTEQQQDELVSAARNPASPVRRGVDRRRGVSAEARRTGKPAPSRGSDDRRPPAAVAPETPLRAAMSAPPSRRPGPQRGVAVTQEQQERFDRAREAQEKAVGAGRTNGGR